MSQNAQESERKKIYNRGYSKGKYDRINSIDPKFAENVESTDIFTIGYIKSYFRDNPDEKKCTKSITHDQKRLMRTKNVIPVAPESAITSDNTQFIVVDEHGNVITQTAQNETDREAAETGDGNTHGEIDQETAGTLDNNTQGESHIIDTLHASDKAFITDATAVAISSDYIQLCMHELIEKKKLPSPIIQCINVLNAQHICHKLKE